MQARCRRCAARAESGSVDGVERAQRIRELEALALRTGQTQLFIETPYRNLALWEALMKTLQHNTRIAIGTGLTLAGGRCASRAVKAWKPLPCPLDNSTPAVFALGR